MNEESILAWNIIEKQVLTCFLQVKRERERLLS